MFQCSYAYIKICSLNWQQLSCLLFPFFFLFKITQQRKTLFILFNHIFREEPQKTNCRVKGSNILFMHIAKVLSKTIRLIYNPTNKKGHVPFTDSSALLTISNLLSKTKTNKKQKLLVLVLLLMENIFIFIKHIFLVSYLFSLLF